MHRNYSGWNPKLRERVEKIIIESLSRKPNLTIYDIRAYVHKTGKITKNQSLTHASIKCLCASLYARGVLTKTGKVGKRTLWSLAVKAT